MCFGNFFVFNDLGFFPDLQIQKTFESIPGFSFIETSSKMGFGVREVFAKALEMHILGKEKGPRGGERSGCLQCQVF